MLISSVEYQMRQEEKLEYVYLKPEYCSSRKRLAFSSFVLILKAIGFLHMSWIREFVKNPKR